MDNITFIKGNIFNTKAQTVVNTVNCVGVMGKGIALVYKLRYPKMYDIYKDYCRQHLINIGKLWIYKGDENDPWVLNFPTKFHWKYPSKYEYIEKGLAKFVESYESHGVTSIAFISSKIVPIMTIGYLLLGLYIDFELSTGANVTF